MKEHNLDRLVYATALDVELACSKVEACARALRRSATAEHFSVDAIESSVVEPAGWAAALDCDAIFSCVDRPWARAALNLAAYTHLIPVVDGGVAVDLSRGRLRGADWKAHIAAPARRCLECAGQYNPGLVQAEREGHFENAAYIRGLPEDHPLRRNENVFAFGASAASFEVLQFLSMVVEPNGVANVVPRTPPRHRRPRHGVRPVPVRMPVPRGLGRPRGGRRRIADGDARCRRARARRALRTANPPRSRTSPPAVLRRAPGVELMRSRGHTDRPAVPSAANGQRRHASAGPPAAGQCEEGKTDARSC